MQPPPPKPHNRDSQYDLRKSETGGRDSPKQASDSRTRWIRNLRDSTRLQGAECQLTVQQKGWAWADGDEPHRGIIIDNSQARTVLFSLRSLLDEDHEKLRIFEKSRPPTMIARPWHASLKLQLNHRKPRNFLKRPKFVQAYHIHMIQQALSRILSLGLSKTTRHYSISADT